MDVYVKKGKIYKILPVQEKSDKFRKQEFILQETNPTDKGTFIEFIRMQLINEKINYIDNVSKGDFVVCKFSISGRKVGKGEEEAFYTNLDIIELVVINKTSDVISGADIRPSSSSTSFSELFPGIDKDDETDPEPMSEPGEIKDDLPF